LKKVFFNKVVVIALLALLALSLGIKIHSALTPLEVSNWNYENLKQIDKDQTNFSFAVFGDNKNSVTTFNHLIDRVNQEDVSFSIDNGDLVYDGDIEKYKFFLAQAERFQEPLLTSVGNHEILEGGRANYYDIFGPFYYSFQIGQSYFIVLDDSEAKALDPTQMDWLESELAKSQAYKYRFVVMHVPLYDPRTTGQALGHALEDPDAAAQLNQLFDDNSITMIFASHIHDYITGVWGKTPYIISGGAGAEIYGGDSGEAIFHYVIVHVSDVGVTYDLVKLPTPGSAIGKLLYDAWIYIYAYVALHFWNIVITLVLLYFAVFFAFTIISQLRRKNVEDAETRSED
jgi:Calcineurin-like phosphoesterase